MGCLIIILIFILIIFAYEDPAWCVFAVIFGGGMGLLGGVLDSERKKRKKLIADKQISDEKSISDISKQLPAVVEPTPAPIVIKLSILQFEGIQEAVGRGIRFCKRLSDDDELRNDFYHQAVNSSTYQTYSANDFFSTLKFFFANDLFDCFNHLGHGLDKIAKTEKPVSIDYTQSAGQALFATLSSLADYKSGYKSFRYSVLSLNKKSDNPYDEQIRQVTENTLPVYLNSGASIKIKDVEDFNLVLLFLSLGKFELVPVIREIYYDFSNAVALSDNNKDEAERAWLDDLKEKIVTKSIPNPSNNDDETLGEDNGNGTETEEVKEEQTDKLQEDIVKEDPMLQLNELVGLKQVKSELQTLTRFIEVNQKRREAGLRVANISYHCVFAGNPGTGKTTVARILAGIYKQLGILKKGQLVETDRSGLVAEYVGQTAVKTNKIIDKAIGGVLFIDEAYTLAQGGEQDYGREAIATLLKRMEDDRDRLVVILAGYTNEIEEFINSNPGLRSRFNRYVHFEDYTEDELFQIFLLQAKKYDYQLDVEAEAALHALLKEKVANKQKDFGNARYVRNLFEKVIENQAVRLSNSQNLDKGSLAVITKEDIRE